MPAIIFDFDGVIVNTEPLHEEALLRCARERGMDFTHQQYMNSLIGLADRDCLPVLFELNGKRPTAQEHHDFFSHKKKLVHAMILEGRAEPFSGTLRLIREASERIPIAICSGAIRSEIELVLDKLELREHFRAIVSADEVKHSKPHPEGYERAAASVGVHPASCIAIEDTPTGCRAAIAAGLQVIAVGHSLSRDAFPKEIRHFAPTSNDLELSGVLALAAQ